MCNAGNLIKEQSGEVLRVQGDFGEIVGVSGGISCFV
jgi:hypothetical protein